MQYSATNEVTIWQQLQQ